MWWPYHCHYPSHTRVWLLSRSQTWEDEQDASETCSCEMESLVYFSHLWSDPFRLREQNSGSDTQPRCLPPDPGSSQFLRFSSSPAILLSERSKERELLLLFNSRGITRQNSQPLPFTLSELNVLDVCGHVALCSQSPGRKLPLTAACAAAFCQLPLLSKLHPCVRRRRPAKCCRAFLWYLSLGTGYWVGSWDITFVFKG